MIKKICIITLLLFVAGCSSKGIVATIFLKETNRKFYNLKGDACMEDGYEIINEKDEKHYDLITFYKNCDVHEERQLEEFEIKQWPTKPKTDIHLE